MEGLRKLEPPVFTDMTIYTYFPEIQDNQALVPVSCCHGEFTPARCMWDREECLANGRVDPQPFISCRSEWPARSRPPHLVELAQGLPRSQPGERWPAVGSTLQLAELLEEGVPQPIALPLAPTTHES